MKRKGCGNYHSHTDYIKHLPFLREAQAQGRHFQLKQDKGSEGQLASLCFILSYTQWVDDT